MNPTHPLLHELNRALLDTSVTDICAGPQGLNLDRGGKLESVNLRASSTDEDHLRAWVLDQLARVGRSWDARCPFADATLESGHRLHVAFPPIARQGTSLSLRRLPGQSHALLPPSSRWPQTEAYALLRQIVRQGESLLISGATGSGKTTLANDLLAEIDPHERIIALEDTPELSPSHPHFISLVSRPANADGFGEVTLRTLLRQTLRMRPDRIVLGECRGAEVYDLLQSLNTGHRGALATLHANSPRDAVRRIELLCALHGGGSVPGSMVRELISVGVQWVAQTERTANGRRIREIQRIEGREGDTILMRPVVTSAHHAASSLAEPIAYLAKA